jgi:hypothetical protein
MTGSAEHSAAENGDKHLDDEVREKSLLPVKRHRGEPVTVYRYRLLLLLLLFNTTRTFRTPKHEVWTAVQFTNSRKENVG